MSKSLGRGGLLFFLVFVLLHSSAIKIDGIIEFDIACVDGLREHSRP
ncbi:MAG: hypothetical protein PSN37_00710 [Alphaproteobacteria bacterium]|nr:hypothetical protein [Alphaproteobacteria bacterium]